MKRFQATIALFVILQLVPGALELVGGIVHYVRFHHVVVSAAEGHHHHHNHQSEGFSHHHCSGSCSCAPSLLLMTHSNSDGPHRGPALSLQTPYPHQRLLSGYASLLFRPPRSLA